jgi:hypothetical protein
MSGNNAGAIVRDFHHGEDHLQIDTYDAGPGTLTHSGDLWTVHDQEGNVTFELAGITSLTTTITHLCDGYEGFSELIAMASNVRRAARRCAPEQPQTLGASGRSSSRLSVDRTSGTGLESAVPARQITVY